MGLQELKDVLWQEMNSESNKIAAIQQTETLVHHDKDFSQLRIEMADENEDDDFDWADDEAEDIDDIEDYEDFDYIDDEDANA